MDNMTITTPSGIDDEEMRMASSENVDPQLQIPELQSAPPCPLNLKRKQPPPKKKSKITQRRNKQYKASYQSLTSTQQQQQHQQHQQHLHNQPQQQQPHATSQNVDDEPTISESVVALATLPPSKLARKITSLQNKLVCESEWRVVAESKYSTKKDECKAAEQEFRREKKVSNKLIAQPPSSTHWVTGTILHPAPPRVPPTLLHLVRSLFHFDSGLSIIGPRSEGASFCGGGVDGEENGSISQQKLVVALTWSISTIIGRGRSGGSTISSIPCTPDGMRYRTNWSLDFMLLRNAIQ